MANWLYCLRYCIGGIEFTEKDLRSCSNFKIGLDSFYCVDVIRFNDFLEAQVDQNDFSVLFIGLIVYFALLFLMVLGCMSANACYFVLENKRKEIF